jgi:hypothetical protein
MKKLVFLISALALILGACLPAAPQPAANTPIPLSEDDLKATAAVISQQTLQAFPTDTALPTETPVVMMPTETAILDTPTETPNPVLLTLTATLGTGTVDAPITGSETPPFTGTPVTAPGTHTTTPQPLAHGTLPPHVPGGSILILNQAKVEAYISLRCVRPDGGVSILEYPVKTSAGGRAPAGKYTYVAWVGGRQFTGSFSLDKDGEVTITLLKDKVTIKNPK